MSLFLVFLLGLAVGSFLNVLSLRTLKGESIICPPSHCMGCEHRLSLWDNVPLLSFVWLKGKCRYCTTPISWQYPVVELSTAALFVVLAKVFGLSFQTLGLAIFVATLIAVTVTDFREKIIPHDITYPSMLLGITFSALIRRDFVGAMVGIGASYIIFDFLAHYGLKFYLSFYGSAKEKFSAESDASVDEALNLHHDAETAESLDEFEVMGGGDAVLSAVISAWLGWQRLVVALIVGFIAGTIMGMIFLLSEMRKADLLKQCYKPLVIGIILGFLITALPLCALGLVIGVTVQPLSWIAAGLLGSIGGGLLGIVSVGTRVSKPFPFGPALSLGAMVAIFWDPVGAILSGGA